MMEKEPLKAMKPEELLKENDWEKIITEKIQKVISTKIDVLNQDYNKERQIQNKLRENKGDDNPFNEDPQDESVTQIRTYVNHVMIKIDQSFVLKIE